MASHPPNDPAAAAALLAALPKAKRKRLTKACDACHKSKRRCDGTCPCANCEFANKICNYTDATGQHIPPPLERPPLLAPGPRNNPWPSGSFQDQSPIDSKKRKASQGPYIVTDQQVPLQPPGPDSAAGSSSAVQSSASDSPLTSEQVWPSPHDIGIDSVIAHELVNLFFLHLHPYNLAFHRPTFLNDLSTGRVPLYLLCAVLALAAPLSTLPRVVTNPRHNAGERFARAAKHMILDPGGRLIVKPSLEVAQALTLITMHDCIGRQVGRRTDYYQHIALDILVDGGVRTFDVMPVADMSRGEWVRRETARRLFYLIYTIELLASVWTRRPLSHRERDLRIFLPLDESNFELAVMDRSIQREYLLPLTPQHGGRSKTSPFGFLVRVVAVYTRISDNLFARKHDPNEGGFSLHTNNQLPPTIADIINDGEDALRTWERSLPSALAFNEQNLQSHVVTLQSGANIGVWCYFYMHAIAECCVLALQEAAEVERLQNRQNTTETRQRALDNLKVILTSLGRQGRTSIMMGNILEAGAKHGILSSRDPEVAAWYTDWENLWGISLDQLTSVEFRRNWVPDWPQDHLMGVAGPSSGPPSAVPELRYAGPAYGLRTAVEGDEISGVSSPPVTHTRTFSSGRDASDRHHQTEHLPPLRAIGDPGMQSPRSFSVRSIQSSDSADGSPRNPAPPSANSQFDRRGHGHSYSSGSSVQTPTRDYHISPRLETSTDGPLGSYDSYHLPPARFAGHEEPQRAHSRQDDRGLPSIRTVGLLNEAGAEGGRSGDAPRSRSSPSPPRGAHSSR